MKKGFRVIGFLMYPIEFKHYLTQKKGIKARTVKFSAIIQNDYIFKKKSDIACYE